MKPILFACPLILLLILIPILILALPSSAFACTSFAVYGNQIFYAMNFDYFAVPLKFLLESRPDMAVFHLCFLYEKTIDDPAYKGYFAKTCGMNSQGLFCASQEIEPFVQGRKIPSEGESHIDDQYEALYDCSRIDQVKEKIGGSQWIQFLGPSIHNLFADAHGQAMVTETDNTQNYLTPMEGDFMVMANFANHSLAGKSQAQKQDQNRAQGAGADRYGIVHDFLSDNQQPFSIEKGFHLLKKAEFIGQGREKGAKTLCSLVCHPESQSVYVALDLNTDRTWKISLADQTLETYAGYQRYEKMALGEKGIRSEELVQLGI